MEEIGARAAALVHRNGVGYRLFGILIPEHTVLLAGVGASGVVDKYLAGAYRIARGLPRENILAGSAECVVFFLVGIHQLVDERPLYVAPVPFESPPAVRAAPELFEQYRVILELRHCVVNYRRHARVGIVHGLYDYRKQRIGVKLLVAEIFFYLVFVALIVLAGEVCIAVRLLKRKLAVFLIPAVVTRDMVGNLEKLEQYHRAQRPVLIALTVAVEIIFPCHTRP